ncbi:hypothetical protein T07_1085 [Trichinella nelsoni]|uniref:Uncharacterized protein n=1 Tax=Trichinella nelsoni TaxID=6336 RepID=A0A0V0SEU5_9BILA|nr:hypothetical protein T07_1085 [Trichinella nelsoni]
MPCMLLYIYGEWKLAGTSDAEDEEVSISLDYCSVHVSTMISRCVSTVPLSGFLHRHMQWNYFYELEYLSLMVVQVSLNGLKRCTKICKLCLRLCLRQSPENFNFLKYSPRLYPQATP